MSRSTLDSKVSVDSSLGDIPIQAGVDPNDEVVISVAPRWSIFKVRLMGAPSGLPNAPVPEPELESKTAGHQSSPHRAPEGY